MERFLEKAKDYIDRGDPDSLVHAALELRLAIEDHVYSKLAFYSKRHPSKLLFKHWQPDRAIKVLCQLEPRADLSYVVSYAPERSGNSSNMPFKELGKHESLSYSWIRKNYNKLGSFLHLGIDESEKIKEIKKIYLEPIYKELLRVSKSSLICDFSETIYFICQLCESKIVSCVDALPNVDQVFCPNPSCNATYIPKLIDDEWMFKINATDFNCPRCGGQEPVLTNELKLGLLITCGECRCRYVISEFSWGFKEI